MYLYIQGMRRKKRACWPPLSSISLSAFDDGPYKFHKELDTTLNNAGVHATYFLNGYNYELSPQAIRAQREMNF